jgi:hypothetical protein
LFSESLAFAIAIFGPMLKMAGVPTVFVTAERSA